MLEEVVLGFVLFSIPALIYGILVVIPLLLFTVYQRFSHRYFPKLNSFVLIVTSIASFAVALLFTVRSIISFGYAVETPYGYGLQIPNDASEKQVFDSAVINEATYRSLTPVYFQKPCMRTPELVCQIASKHTINLLEYRIPFVNGILSTTASILLGLRARNWIGMSFRKDYEEV